jgi:hypothetical protein
MTAIVTEFLTVLVVSVGLQGRNNLLFVDSCAAHMQAKHLISMKQNLCIIYQNARL